MKQTIPIHVFTMARFILFAMVIQLLTLTYLLASEREGAADVTVTGTVSDANGAPIPGVTIFADGTSLGTVSDLEGKYSLTVPEEAVLVFSFIGYETQKIPIGGKSIIDVTLNEDMASLDEVIVVGYGTQKKVNLTGAVENITGDEIARQPLMQASQALMGKMAGVTVLQNSSQPGSDAASIRIRGIGTLGNSDPLVLIDGVP